MTVRVLIIDDNATNMKLASDVLAAEDCEVVCAGDAEHAEAELSRKLPDVILMDIAMPGTDGLTLTRRLKARESYRNIPIVALTASAMKGDDQRALAAGCEGYITKPIDTRRFGRQVLAFVGRANRAYPARPDSSPQDVDGPQAEEGPHGPHPGR